MKALKWFVGVAIGLAIVFIGGGLMISPNFVVTRSIVIRAPSGKVFGLIEDPRVWPNWVVWTQRDPDVHIEYHGPQTGSGAQWAWCSRAQGCRSVTFVRVVPGERIAYELFLAEFGAISTGMLEVAAQGGATRVTWNLNGDVGSDPFVRWMTYFIARGMGRDLDAGLANLKMLAEQ